MKKLSTKKGMENAVKSTEFMLKPKQIIFSPNKSNFKINDLPNDLLWCLRALYLHGIISERERDKGKKRFDKLVKTKYGLIENVKE